MDGTRNRIDAVEFALDCDRYPKLAKALAYWRSQRHGRFAPTRTDIDPADIVAVLSRGPAGILRQGTGRPGE